MTDQAEWTRAVVRVGDGRGFVAGNGRKRFVITAAHCLPALPPPAGASYIEQRTFSALLGQLGDQPSISAECLFADSIADLAVLGSPDNQGLFDQARAYSELVETVAPLRIGVLERGRQPIFGAPAVSRAWLISLAGEWFRCGVIVHSQALWLENADQDLVGGMSGSPIVSASDGAAVGILCQATGRRQGGPNPLLSCALPGWCSG